MARRFMLAILFAASFGALVFATGTDRCEAGDCGYDARQLDLFYNYYISGGCTEQGIGAKMYPSPRPTPRHVGHTYYTYPPLMPHEFMYKHHRTYMRRHADGSATRTRVSWF